MVQILILYVYKANTRYIPYNYCTLLKVPGLGVTCLTNGFSLESVFFLWKLFKNFFAIFQLPFNWIEKNKDKRADKYVLEKENSEKSTATWFLQFLINSLFD